MGRKVGLGGKKQVWDMLSLSCLWNTRNQTVNKLLEHVVLDCQV